MSEQPTKPQSAECKDYLCFAPQPDPATRRRVKKGIGHTRPDVIIDMESE